ncbi:MAG: phosphoenolpyruvate synthase [Chloroflexi bacterium]|nr:phosphoenolpyruvate synthase [Chloroflexota bacterium]
MNKSHRYTLPFTAVNAADLPIVGGKGANLGEMTQAGFPIPAGFCITTAAFHQFLTHYPEMELLYASLDSLDMADLTAVQQVGQTVRQALTAVPIPTDVQQAIVTAWEEAGGEHSYAVRSSATAEDLPDASFAGQQDTFLNVCGADDLLDSIRHCWVSLFTDRAILYRMQNQFSHRDVALSVVVQRMVQPDVSGILFTADPITGQRHITSIDASYGLGETLVAGLVNPDLYKIDKRNDRIISQHIGEKQIAIRPLPSGGTTQEETPLAQQAQSALTSAQIKELSQLGSRIEDHYGRPQDIEWCLESGRFFIVQSRPITSLYPVPQPMPVDGSWRLYFSFSHAQVMTDPMPPLALSIWRTVFPFGQPEELDNLNPYLGSAGGRLYIDLTPALHSPLPRRILPRILTVADPLSAQTIQQLMKQDSFWQRPPQIRTRTRDVAHWTLPLFTDAIANLWWRKPEGVTDWVLADIDRCIGESQALLMAVPPGAARLRIAQQMLVDVFIQEAIKIPPYLAAGIIAQQLLSRIARKTDSAQDVTAVLRGLSGNVTTEMDMAVGDLADAARPSSTLTAHLKTQATLPGEDILPIDAPFRLVFQKFLAQYGMRGPSEIDISRPRWQDDPSSLLRMVVGNLGQAEPGLHRQYHQQLQEAGEAAGERLAAVAHHGLAGPLRAKVVRRLVRVARNLLPVREHPKFLLVRLFGLVRTAVLEAGNILHGQNRLDEVSDVWYLELPELVAAFADVDVDLRARICQRRADLIRYQKMTPPRLITSDGEIPVIKLLPGDIPEGALAGSPVSAGVVEGIARVIHDPTQEILQPGEILVAPFTDPGWTPLFINAAGLVMEVGGLMTHGSVVAREYGIPAVVALPEATTRIQTGQRLRVNGDAGYVEIMGE